MADHNDTKNNYTQHNNTQNNDIQHNNNQPNKHKNYHKCQPQKLLKIMNNQLY